MDARVAALRPVAYTTGEQTKLAAIETGATADQTGPEVVTLLQALAGDARLQYSALRGTPAIPDVTGFLSQAQVDARVTSLRPVAYSQTEKTKLAGIEASATADQTAAEIRDALAGLSGASRLGYSAIKDAPAGFPAAWSSSTSYSVGTLVRHANVIYQASTAHSDSEPGVDDDWADNWTAIFDANTIAWEDITGRPGRSNGTLIGARRQFIPYLHEILIGDAVQMFGEGTDQADQPILIPASGTLEISFLNEYISGTVYVPAYGLRRTNINTRTGHILYGGTPSQHFISFWARLRNGDYQLMVRQNIEASTITFGFSKIRVTHFEDGAEGSI